MNFSLFFYFKMKKKYVGLVKINQIQYDHNSK